MGVSGLERWCDEHAADAVNLAPLRTGTRVLIDGCGLCFFVLREVGARAQAGDYAALDRAFMALFLNLQQAGMIPEVYLDGPATRLKSDTIAHRVSERQRRLEPVQLACLDGVAVRAEELPKPILMYEQLACSAAAAGVRLVRCEGEADVDLAAACAAAEDGLGVILAQDSDFLVFRGARYVRLSDLLVVSGAAGRAVPPGEAAGDGELVRVLAPVWTRDLLCEASGLSSDRVVEWAALCGTDATRGYQLASFGAAVADSLGGDGMTSVRPSTEDIRTWLAEHAAGRPAGWLETSAEPSLGLALRYTRALYEIDLPALDAFPLDRTASRAEPLELMPRGNADVSSVGRAALAELAHGGRGLVVARLDGEQHAPVQLRPWQEQALRRLIQGERVAGVVAGSGAERAGVGQAGAEVPPDWRTREGGGGSRGGQGGNRREGGGGRRNHLAGRVAAPAASGGLGSIAARQASAGLPPLPPSLSWDDVQIATRYQSLCKLLLWSGALPAEPPSSLFDGPTFYALCHSLRAELASAGRPPRDGGTARPGAAQGRDGMGSARPERSLTDAAAYGASACTQCGRHADGGVDQTDSQWYCHECWDEWSGGAAGSGSAGGGGVRRSADDDATRNLASEPPARPRLPVDAFEEEILSRISSHRVSLIAGETGCGKSSRVPEMLLRAMPSARLMVAQPRRIAAHALFERARGGVDAALYGLRMGHGVRDENPSTRCWYVTTGYLVRLAGRGASVRRGGGGAQRGAVSGLSHIIIDECHERATDSDLLCLLARRLLESHPRLRIVLMSATLHAKLLLDYFAATIGPSAVAPPLAVGVRRFPLDELFLEETIDELGPSLPDRLRSTATKLAKASLAAVGQGKRVPAEVVTAMVELVPWVVRLATATAGANGQLAGGGESPGGAVLVFVPGMAEIEEIADSLQSVAHYRFIPIHSQLPFEDQLEAFAPSPPGIVKVVVATNAAESSLTLPDVDAVIDLGLHKLLSYSTEMRSAVLRREWVSKASAQQRAGRTARVRPGRVYRLYPRAVWEAFPDFESAQMCREPLEASVLRLRSVLDEGQPISQLMRQMIEPPDLSHVADALLGLAKMGMLECDPNAQAAGSTTGSGMSRIDAVAAAVAAEAADAVEARVAAPAQGEAPQLAGAAEQRRSSASTVDQELATDMHRMGMGQAGGTLGGAAGDAGGEHGWSAEASALDTARLTPAGRLASGLPIEPQLSRLVALGIRLGCAAEAVIIAAACAQPRTPFRIVSPLVYTDPDEYNDLVRAGFDGRLYFDRGMYSEPLAYVALVADIERLLTGGEASGGHSGADGGEEGGAAPAGVGMGAAAAGGQRSSRRGRRGGTGGGSRAAAAAAVSADATSPAAVAAAQPSSVSGAASHGSLRMSQRASRFCVQHGLAPKQVRQLLSTVSSLRQAVRDTTGLPASHFALPVGQHFPPPGRNGSFRLALLRALLVWTCPDIVLVTDGTSGGGRRGPARAESRGAGDVVSLSPELPDAALRRLLPPPIEWDVERRCCDVVHLANASLCVPAATATIEAELLGSRRLDWVFFYQVDGSLRIWVRQEKLEPHRNELAGCLGRDPAALARALALIDVPAPQGSSTRYAMLVEGVLSKPKQAALRHFSSRRGVAFAQRVASIRVQEMSCGIFGGSLVCSNAPPLCSPPTGAAAALTPASYVLLRGIFGEDVIAKASPGQAAPAQVLRFQTPPPASAESETAPHAAAQPPQPPLVRDRPPGVRLLCSMVSGYRDRRLRVSLPSADGDSLTAVPVMMDAPEGLDWRWQADARQCKALLERHSVLKTALPAQPGPLCAVGTSVVMLGDGGNIAAIEGATLLPPGIEWVALLLECIGHRSLPLAAPHGALLSSQLARARELAPLVQQSAIELQPELVRKMRKLLDPWLALCDEGGATGPAGAPGDPDGSCPICYAVVHDTSLELPRLECPTCSKNFHATCLYRWFASEQKKSSTLDNLCPLCQCAV